MVRVSCLMASTEAPARCSTASGRSTNWWRMRMMQMTGSPGGWEERRGGVARRGGEKERREGGKRVGWVGEVDERMSG